MHISLQLQVLPSVLYLVVKHKLKQLLKHACITGAASDTSAKYIPNFLPEPPHNETVQMILGQHLNEST